MKKTIVIMLLLILMAVGVSADVYINQTISSEEDIYHSVELYADGDIYTDGAVTYSNTNTHTTTYVPGGFSAMSSLYRMVDIFESPSSQLDNDEKKFMYRFMNFVTYLFDYFNEERISNLEFEVLSLRASLNTVNPQLLCDAEIKVAFDVYNMTQYQCDNNITYHNDNSGGYIVLV